MTVSYTEEMQLPLQEDGGRNWGAVINGVFELLEKGHEMSFTAGEAIPAGAAVAISQTDKFIYLALATDPDLTPAIGIAPNAIASGQKGKVRGWGYLDVDTSWSAGAQASWSPGEAVYVDTVAGRLRKTAISWGNYVGYSKSWTDADYQTRIVLRPENRYAVMCESIRVQHQATFAAVVNNGSSGAAKTIDWTAGNKQKIVLTDDCVFTFTAPRGPASLTLVIEQDATGSRTVTWPGTVLWPGAASPVLTAAAYSKDLVCLFWDGINYWGAAALAFGT